MRRFILAGVLSLLFVTLHAQTSVPVIMRLRSGIELRGHIVKTNPDGSTEIKTESGDIFVYRQSEISSINIDQEAKKIEQEEQRKRELIEQERQRQARLEALRQQQEREAELARQQAEEQRKKKENAKQLLAEKRKAYNEEYRNRGLINSFEFSYTLQQAEGEAILTNMGHQTYGNLRPIEFDYMLGYRFSNLFALNIGTGVSYNMVDIDPGKDSFVVTEPKDAHIEYKQINVPIYANMRLYLSRGKVQPMLSLSGGLYVMTKTALVDAGVGLNFRLGRCYNLYIMVSGKTSPWISFDGMTYEGYKAVFSPSFKVGFSL